MGSMRGRARRWRIASGNGNTGTVANATWSATGKFGKALSFNGTSSRVNVPDAAALHLTTGMTLEAWVNPAVGADGLARRDLQGQRQLLPRGVVEQRQQAGRRARSSAAARRGVRHRPARDRHLGASGRTYDGAALRLYLNGTQVASAAAHRQHPTSTNALQIGSDSIYGQYFNGLIDEVRIYNIALSAAQIQTDMTTAIGGGAPPPDTTPPTRPAR